jgi:hypothetical protein
MLDVHGLQIAVLIADCSGDAHGRGDKCGALAGFAINISEYFEKTGRYIKK